MSSTVSQPRISRGRRVLRWTLRVLAVVVVLLLVTTGVVYAVSASRMSRRFEVPVHPLTIRNDSATLARGARLAELRGCTSCHGARLQGNTIFDVPLMGRLVPPNLTTGKGGRGSELAPEDWERAIRHGLRKDGSPLMVMPAQEFQYLTDEDVAAIVAWGRSLPPVDNVVAESQIGPIGRALYILGQLDVTPAAKVEHHRPHEATLMPTATVEYGKYLAQSCTGCHGPGYSGGKFPGAPESEPPSGNLTPDRATGIGSWTEADFLRATRDGVRPDGSRIDERYMPLRITRAMTDVELQAIYRFLRTLPPKPKGGR